MSTPTILVEGKSIQVYLQATMANFSTSLAPLVARIENPGGWSQVNACLGELLSGGQRDSVFVIWDQDVLAKPDGMPAAHLIDHPLRDTFTRDFEEIFPDWMVANALATYNPQAGYPGETEIGNSCRDRGSAQPFYERLRTCAKAHAREAGRDPATIDIPSKVDLAKCLAKVANRTWYQPEEMRRLLDRLIALFGGSGDSQSLIQAGANVSQFVLNSQVIEHFNLHGKLALRVQQDLWIMDLDALAAEKVVSDLVDGSPCWSHDGSGIAFPAQPSHPDMVRNSEAIRVYNLVSGLSDERLMI